MSPCHFFLHISNFLHMKFFIDTANLDHIKEAKDLGILDGVTTNPSLMAKEKSEFRKLSQYSKILMVVGLLFILFNLFQ